MVLSKIKILSLLNLASVIIALIFNYMAIALPINNKTTGELADKYENYFVPAGFTFSIWGIIYLAILVFSAYTIYIAFKKDDADHNYVSRLSVWFIIANLANGVWLIFWHYEWVIFSFITMLVILFNLLDMYYKMAESRPHSLPATLCLFVPISIYLGWISVATIANITAALVSVEWQGGFWHPSVWAVVMVGIATLLGIILIYVRGDQVFALVITWALYGIYSKRMVLNDAESLHVAKAAQYGLTLLLLYAALSLVGRKSYLFDKVGS